MQLKKSNLSMNTAVFEAFNQLTIDDSKVRIKGACRLIKIIEETDEEKVKKIYFL
jgi:hypothetical protein